MYPESDDRNEYKPEWGAGLKNFNSDEIPNTDSYLWRTTRFRKQSQVRITKCDPSLNKAVNL